MHDTEKLRASALCDVIWSLGILDDLPVDTFKQLTSLLEQQPLRDFQPRVRRAPDPFEQLYLKLRSEQARSALIMARQLFQR